MNVREVVMELRTPAEEFPQTIAAIQALGRTDAERAVALTVKHAKTVERLRKRFPASLIPFLRSPHAATLLRAMLADVERRLTPPD